MMECSWAVMKASRTDRNLDLVRACATVEDLVVQMVALMAPQIQMGIN